MAGNSFISFAIRASATALSSAGINAKLQILIYHNVLAEPDPLRPSEVDAKAFRDQMRIMAKYFNVLPLTDALERMQRNALPSRAACITFDDGYSDNAEVALPILREFGLQATFFVTTGFLNGGMMWNDRVIESVRQAPDPVLDLAASGLGVHKIADTKQKVATIKTLLTELKHKPFNERAEKVAAIVDITGAALKPMMMTDQQVEMLSQHGMEIGAHTMNHPILAKLDDEEAEQEIVQSKAYLESILDEPVKIFAYPNGKRGKDYLPKHVDMVRRAGFQAAVSTDWGVSSRKADSFQLRRFTPWDRTPLRFAMRLVQNSLKVG